MAVMRLRIRPSALFAVLLLLALPVVAAAEIKPIPKPETTKAQPAKSPEPVSSTPPASPPPSTTSTASTTATASTTSTTSTATGSTGTTSQAGSTTPATTGSATPDTTGATTPVTTEKIVVVASEGGRDQSGVVVPAIPPPDPTPLALVAASEPVPSQDSATPAWKLALLALLAAAEAFLVVRLVRHRPVTLSPAQ
jgi:hypothetical protein